MSATPHALAQPALSRRKLHAYRLGLGLLLFAEAMVFLTLFTIRFLLAGTGHPAALDQWLGLALTGLMWASIFPARDALEAARRGESRRAAGSLLLTLLAGLLVLALVGIEWATIDLSAGSRFGGIFLTASAFHAVHMLAAVLVLAGLAIQALRGRFTPGSHFAVEAGVLFWLFMVGVWVALWTVFYLL